jgi:hypothetical protein
MGVRLRYRHQVRAGWHTGRELPEEPFVYFALSVTPEASTCIVAPEYADQLLAVAALARGLPAGWKLVVKDHAPMCGRRSDAYYARIRGYQNVVLVDPLMTSTDLARRSAVTAVIAGTTGWEALFMGRPVVTLGPAWYLATGLAEYCRHPDDVPGAIRRAQERAGIAAPERRRRLARMVHALRETSFPYTYDQMWAGRTAEELDGDLPSYEAMAAHLMERHAELARTGREDPMSDAGWTTDRTPGPG